MCVLHVPHKLAIHIWSNQSNHKDMTRENIINALIVGEIGQLDYNEYWELILGIKTKRR
jgi:hypothetical protein